MRIAVIGLGRMGANISRRLMRGGHEVVGFDQDSHNVRELASEGGIAANSLEDAACHLEAPRIFWLMVPAGAPTEDTVAALLSIAEAGDVVIDGGNTFFKDDVRRSRECAKRGIHYVDVGTSGGVWGLERGYIHAGPPGAGHFVKMVHNGIEYGLMQAYAEGFDILKGRANPRLAQDERYDLNLTDIAEVWRRGSVISSWLLDLCALGLARDHDLSGFSGTVADSGEGQWTIDAAMEEAVPANVLTTALFARYRSRMDHSFADKLLSAMRFGFGGHVEVPQ